MTVETLKDRIQKAEEKIQKKQGTITKKTTLINKKKDQIQKVGVASDKGQELTCDVEMLQDDVERLRKEIAEVQDKLNGYQEDLKKEVEKVNSRNIPVIIDFLNAWKEDMKTFFASHTEDWIRTLKIYYEEDRKAVAWRNSHFADRKNKELVAEIEKPVKEVKKVHDQYRFLDPYMMMTADTYVLDTEKLERDLNREADRKYDFIIERTNEIVGQITDASNLKIGNKGDLNGYIIGTKGTAKVQTIGAGGYNIQCFHFRTLINELR